MDEMLLLKRDSRSSISFSPLKKMATFPLPKQSSIDFQKSWLLHNMSKIVMVILYYCCTALMVSSTLTHYQTYPIMVRIAKSAAMGINVNLAIITIPVTRNLISQLRASSLNYILPLKHCMYLHTMAGWHIVYFSIVHVAAHCINYLDIANVYGEFDNKMPLVLLLTTLPGYTGLLLSLFTFLMMSALPLKKHHFELFYYSHKLAVPIMLISMVHGIGCFVNTFIGMSCHYYSYKFIPLGLSLHIMDILVNKWTKRLETSILSHEWINNDTIKVVFKSHGKTFKVGSFLFLNVPEISKYQYHPYTITRFDNDTFTLEIKACGEWSNRLLRLIDFDLSKVMIEGPYSSTSVDLTAFNTLLLIGQGIGVTPFKCLLNQVINEYESGCTAIPKIELVNLFKSEEDEKLLDVTHFHQNIPHINIKTFTRDGHWPPNFNDIFGSIYNTMQNQKIGVFVCGSESLANLVELKCLEYSSNDRQFIFTNESF